MPAVSVTLLRHYVVDHLCVGVFAIAASHMQLTQWLATAANLDLKILLVSLSEKPLTILSFSFAFMLLKSTLSPTKPMSFLKFYL